MKLSDLQSKNLVSMEDGKNIGSIIDVKIDYKTGNILSLIVENKNNVFSLFSKDSDIEILWENIKKIGEDVILVNLK